MQRIHADSKIIEVPSVVAEGSVCRFALIVEGGCHALRLTSRCSLRRYTRTGIRWIRAIPVHFMAYRPRVPLSETMDALNVAQQRSLIDLELGAEGSIVSVEDIVRH